MADRSCADYSTAEGVSSPIKKRNGKPCMISCKVSTSSAAVSTITAVSTTALLLA